MGLLDGSPESLSQLGTIAGLLGAKKGDNWGLLLQNQANQIDRRKQLAMQEQMQQMQLQQMQRAQQQDQQREQAMGQLAQQHPDLAQLFQVAPQEAVSRAFPKPQQPKMQFAPNGQAVDMNSLQPGGNFAAPKDWKDPEYVETQKKIRAAGAPSVTTNVMPPREIFKDSLSLKKDFDGQPEVKGFKEVQSAWDQISGALKEPSAANDLAAATKFMKLLDPGSVVRESELAMAMKASGALDRFTNMGNRIMKGEKLTPRQREDFYSAGEQLYNASKGRFGQTVEQYDGIAKQYGLDSQFIPKSKPAEETRQIKMGGKPVDARKAKDGKWYVKSGDKYYEVQD